MNATMKTLAIVVFATILLDCSGKRPAATSVQIALSDKQIGLSKVSVFETPTPDPVDPNEAEPGEQPAVPAAFEGSPPVIPHTVVDFVPITTDGNMCVDCHALEEAGEGDPTPIPVSHYTNLRNDPGKVQAEVVGARYVCTACHASQTDATPLVGNRFGEPAPRE